MQQLVNRDLVVQEAQRGDPDAANRRMTFLRGLPRLSVNESTRSLVKEILRAGCLPAKAQEDAVHISLAAVHGMDYLLTWNCKHIANAVTRYKVLDCFRNFGLGPVIISTPEELPEEEQANVE